MNLLWAVHVVHHQSEDYNLAVALRQAVLSPVTVMPFYLPLAVLGVPDADRSSSSTPLSTLYQFWIHTELVDRMGVLEKVVNTPSLHRVHHAVNPEYLDRNYAATFIVWDQLFGTLRREEAPPVYGVSHPLRSFDPVWAQVQPLWGLVAGAAARALGARGGPLPPRLAGLASGVARARRPTPGRRPGGAAQVRRRSPARGRTATSSPSWRWSIVVAFALLTWHSSSRPARSSRAVAWVLVSLVAGAALLAGRRWAVGLEVVADGGPRRRRGGRPARAVARSGAPRRR